MIFLYHKRWNMNRKVKIILSIILGTLIILLSSKVYAASANITAGKTNIEVGQTTNITVSVSATEAWSLKINSTGGTLAGTTANADAIGSEVTQNVINATFTAQTAGTYTINLTGQVTGSDLIKQPVAKSLTIIVSNPAPVTPTNPTTPTTPTNPTTPSNNGGGTTTKPSNNTQTTIAKSSNSKLSSLQIAEGAITPEFSNSVKEYAISVPNEITKLSISAITDSSKATVRIVENEELQIGENNIEIIVTAEDGSTTTYKVVATRALPELNLQQLNIYYINEEGNKVTLNLEPQFTFNIYEYNITEKLSHTIKKLEIESIATRENAKIEILGNEELKAGKNEIIIKVTETNEAGLEEQKTYKIIVEKEEEPVVASLTTWEKITGWFVGVGSTVGGWVSGNFEKILSGMLLLATATFVGLTIYFAFDYKNYKKLLAKLAELNKTNLMERANVALDPEKAKVPEENVSQEEKLNNIEENDNQDTVEDRASRLKVRRRFK